VSGDTDSNGTLDPDETWTYTASKTAVAGQYSNLATVTVTTPGFSNVADNDNYFGASGGVSIKKFANGQDANTAPGPFVPVGSTVTFTYVVTNPGNVPLSSVVVVDDNGTPGNSADDFNATFTGGDANSNGLLDTTETWTFVSSAIAVPGQYTNTAKVTATPPPGGGAAVSATDPANYFGALPGIRLVKTTNGTDNNVAPGPTVPVGSTVTFTYVVTNPGNVPLSGVVVTDDNGTPGNPADDFNATFTGGDTNSSGLLDTTETWTFTSARVATPGQYTNTAKVTGTPPAGAGAAVSASDTENYVGVAATTTLSTQASAGGPVGTSVNDVATISGGSSPTGNVVFKLFSDSGCTSQVFTSTNSVSGGTATSGNFAPSAPGTFYWTATYNGDPANSSSSSSCRALNESVTITCSTNLTGNVAAVRVTSGSTCVNNATVSSPILVTGGSLFITNSTISGVTASHGGSLSICNSTVNGNLYAAYSTGFVLIGGDGAAGCPGNRIMGTVTLGYNSGGLRLAGNQIAGGVNVYSNTAPGGATDPAGGPARTVVRHNTISGSLGCSGNVPPATNDTVGNSVSGARTGECATL
jgi:hypothetical protein